jgi:hypothetical protein
VEQQLRAVVAHEDAYHFETQLDELSKGRQKHADMLADMAEACAASLSEVHVLKLARASGANTSNPSFRYT